MKEEQKKKHVFLYPSQEGFASIVGMSPTDPLGMYTGVPAEAGEKPVQDADDL